MEIYAILAASFEDSRVKGQGGPRQFEVFVMLPVEISRSLYGLWNSRKESTKSVSLVIYYPQITGGQFVDLRVGGAIGIRQVQGVDGVVTRVAQPVRQLAG